MHKRIVEQIQNYIENAPWKDEVEVYIHPQTTGGFWKMAIKEKNKNGDIYLPHIRNTAQAIGSSYGEGLFTVSEGKWLELN